jgi:hypothetical protein
LPKTGGSRENENGYGLEKKRRVPLVFQLSNQAAITHFGLASAAQCQHRGTPKITNITKIAKKNKISNGCSS